MKPLYFCQASHNLPDPQWSFTQSEPLTRDQVLSRYVEVGEYIPGIEPPPEDYRLEPACKRSKRLAEAMARLDASEHLQEQAA